MSQSIENFDEVLKNHKLSKLDYENSIIKKGDEINQLILQRHEEILLLEEYAKEVK